MDGLSLWGGRQRAASAADVHAAIERLGFVQLDSINVVERAHHHILYSRLEGYRPEHLDELQGQGELFEHWTHDASIIPTSLFPMWRHRFDKVAWGTWLRSQMGRHYKRTLEEVRARIEQEGPLLARDFECPDHRAGPWWDWKPAKAALEYWWRTGELAIPRREGFQKVYDLTHRVLPRSVLEATHEREAYVDWSCRSALERLGVATPRELAQFWGGITPKLASEWCRELLERGKVVAVRLDGDPQTAARASYAFSSWRTRASTVLASPKGTGMRVLSPFDPLIRYRARCTRLFSFEYRFEAFVPEAKRQYGYYVLPVLSYEGAVPSLVARIDPTFDRSTRTLLIRGVWWESPRSATKRAKAALTDAVGDYAAWMGARKIDWAASRR